MTTKCVEYNISGACGGFGMWQPNEGASFVGDADSLLNIIRENLNGFFELGEDDLPEGMDDIRGSIYNQPQRIFGYFDNESPDDEPFYFGIDEIEVEDEII